jgi:hypothetical protein
VRKSHAPPLTHITRPRTLTTRQHDSKRAAVTNLPPHSHPVHNKSRAGKEKVSAE